MSSTDNTADKHMRLTDNTTDKHMCLTDNIADKHMCLTDNIANKRHAGNNEIFIGEQQCADVKRRETDRPTETDRQTDRQTDRHRQTERDRERFRYLCYRYCLYMYSRFKIIISLKNKIRIAKYIPHHSRQ